MATKIKLKFSQTEYEAMSVFITHAAASVNVDGLTSLLVKEALEDMEARFLSKKYKHQKSYQFSISIVEAYVFFDYVAIMGNYEKAICELIYSKQLTPQLQRAVQVRMN